MAASKVCFLLVYAQQSAECTSADLIGVLIHGLKLDLTVAGYICAPLFLLLILNLWTPPIRKSIVRIYVILISVVAAALLTANIVMYQYWGFPLDSSIIQYLKSPAGAVASVTWVEAARSIALFIGFLTIILLTYSAVLKIYRPVSGFRKKYVWAVGLLLCCGLDFLAIRGSVTESVANVSQVYFSSNNFLNHAAVNPVFSFLNSLTNADDSGQEYMFYPTEECERLFSELRGAASPNIQPVVKPEVSKPNIVLIIAESFGCSSVDHEICGKSVAPNFRRLKESGIYFANAFASSFRTDRGVVAILSGFPAQTTSSIMKTPAKSRRLPSVASTLGSNGYHTSYIHGGDLNFTDMSSYLYGTGFDQIIGLNDLDIDVPKGKWGYRDETMADFFLSHISTLKAPFFSVWQTLSSHEPFDVPDMGIEDRMLNSMAYADRCIAKVIDTLRDSKEWNNTIAVIVADHAFAYPYGILNSAVARHRIPILITGGAVAVDEIIEKPVSQTDLASTMLSMLGIDSREFIFSRNALGELPTFGYYVFNNGFGVVDDFGATVYDCTSKHVIEGDDSSSRMLRGKVMLQTTYTQINKL